MTITKTKLGAKINQAYVSYWLAGQLAVDVFCADLPYDHDVWEKQDELTDKLSAATKRLEARLQALEECHEDLTGEKWYPESIVTASIRKELTA